MIFHKESMLSIIISQSRWFIIKSTIRHLIAAVATDMVALVPNLEDVASDMEAMALDTVAQLPNLVAL